MKKSTAAVAEVAAAFAFQYGLGRLLSAAVTDPEEPRTPAADALRLPIIPLPR